jgi:TonB family protein
LLVLFVSSSAIIYAQDPPPPPPPAAEYNPKAWKEFSSAEGRFSVLLPGTPTEKVEFHDSPVGKLEVHIFTLRTFAEYLVMYVEYPPNIEEEGNVRAFLDRIRDGSLEGVNGTLLEEKDISFEGHPGRFMRAQIVDDHVIRVRIFVVKNRLYQVGVIMRDKDAPQGILKFNEETATKFLDSFKLVSGVADTPHTVERGSSPPATGTADASAPTVKVEGEVDRLIKSLREKGEGVIGICEEGANCQPLPDIEGVTAGNKVKMAGGKIISKPQPVYPPIAKAARASGSVQVEMVIDEEGKVIAAQAISGHPLLQASAVKAAREALFTPMLLNGKPVKVAGVITYNFVLQ